MPPDNPSNGGMAMLAAMAKTAGGLESMAGDVLGLKNPGSLFIGILRSRTVEDRLIERFQLKKIYSVKLNEDARKELAQNTGVGEDRKSGIITVSVSDHDRQRARAMATAYVEELNRLVSEVSTSSAHRERVFLGERLTAVKQDLDQASRELGEFSSKNATLDVREQGRAMVEAAATLQGALIGAESQRRALEAIYTPNNGRVRAVEAQAAELRKQLEKLGGKAAGQESGDTANSDSIYPSLRKFPLLGVKYEDLYRRAKVEEMVFETLTQEFEIAKVQEAKETPTVKMLDEANVPERRSFPPRTLITLIGGFAASLGTVAWVVVRQRWVQIETSDPGKQFAQEVFHGVNSLMPWATPNGSRWQAATHRVWIRLRNTADASAETHD
jgi:capsule polysaccharide export protein KpsE/RkpR